MVRKGGDYSFARPSISELKKAGITFVCRYLSHTPAKNLTLKEAEELSAAGIDIVSIWESTALRATEGHEAGVADAKAALDQQRAVDDPRGRDNGKPIYFAVDADVEPKRVIPYFQGVGSVLDVHGAKRVGVYGSAAVCEALKEAGHVQWTWRANPHGWCGYPGKGFNIIQELEQVLKGVDLDYAETTDFGQWRVTAAHAAANGWTVEENVSV